MTVAALALATAGCSVSYPLFGTDPDDAPTGSVVRRDPGDADLTRTSISREVVTSKPLDAPNAALARAGADPSQTSYAPSAAATEPPPGLTPSDWAYARGALGLAMGADATGASVPWANPDTGSYGSFTASAAQTLDKGATCRLFAASHSASGREQRLEGTACRTAAGHWEAVAIKATATRAL